MEKIKVKIGWSGDNYSAIIENINGIIIATHKTLKGVKKQIKSALKFHVECSLENGDDIPEFIIIDKYKLEFELQTSARLQRRLYLEKTLKTESKLVSEESKFVLNEFEKIEFKGKNI